MALLGSLSTSSPVYTATFGTTSPVTGSAPTDAADGLPTADLSQVTVALSAASTKTLSGAGSLQCYEYALPLARWIRVPSADISITTSGVRDVEAGVFVVARFKVAQGSNRVIWIPSGVTFNSGSAGVTITLVGSKAVMASTGAGF